MVLIEVTNDVALVCAVKAPVAVDPIGGVELDPRSEDAVNDASGTKDVAVLLRPNDRLLAVCPDEEAFSDIAVVLRVRGLDVSTEMPTVPVPDGPLEGIVELVAGSGTPFDVRRVEVKPRDVGVASLVSDPLVEGRVLVAMAVESSCLVDELDLAGPGAV
jgi:hypothetical protein